MLHSISPYFYFGGNLLNDRLHPVADVVSDITGKRYNPDNCVYIKNPAQYAMYLKNRRVPLLDIIVGDDNKAAHVFDRETSRPFYELWLAHELK